jgi:hypothetical protein
MKKKAKTLTSFLILPEEILLELFSYLPPKDLIRTSNVSRDIQILIQRNFSSKEFFLSMMEKFNLFQPILKEKTISKFYSSLSLFFHFIFHPMETTKNSILKLKEKTTEIFLTSNDFNFETLKQILEEKLKQNIEIPPSNQMFFLLCQQWGNHKTDFSLEGNSILKIRKFLSKACDCSSIFKKSSKIPIQYMDLGRIEKFGFKCFFFVCLDSGENFGKIMGKIGEDGYLGFSIKSFSQMIHGIGEFKNFKFDYHELHAFVNSLEFEYSNKLKIIGIQEESESSESESIGEEFEDESEEFDFRE